MTGLRDVPLLSTKLYIPRPSPNLVRRPRLIARLEEGLRMGHRLALISAPAGFGKTTLLSEWIHHAGEEVFPPQATWVSLDEGDNDPARLWAYVVAALGRLRPGVGRNALALLHSPQPAPPEAVLTTLINELAAVSVPPEARTGPRFVLVLDDYHVIEAPAVHGSVAFLVEHLPPNLHLVIAGRTDPALPLARLRARGQMIELREADLRFTRAEAAAFLNQATGLALSEGEVTALEARTEGWIAGLQLAALSMQGSPDVRGFIQAFSGSHRFVIDFLADEVLRQQPVQIRGFLRDTAILERLTGPLCDALTGREDGQSTLTRLERANLFLIPLDDHREWYRYHRLFADLLRADLQEAEPERVRELHRRAAGWYERNGLSAEAVRHALAAGASEQAGRLIEQAAPTTLWVRGEVATLLGWLASLPDGFARSRPSLCLVHAWALLLSAQFEAVGTRLQEVEAALQVTPVPDDQMKRVRDEITVMRAMLANFQGDTPRAIELSQQSLTLVPADNSFLRGALLGNLGGAYMEIGDAARASQSFAEAAHTYRATDNTFMTLTAVGFLGNMQVALGQLRQAAKTFQQTLELATEEDAQQSLGAHIAHVGLGAILYEWNDLSAATRQLEAGIEMGERQEGVNLGPGPLMLMEGYLTMARLHHLEGHPDGTLEMLKKAERLAQAHIPPELGHVAAARARLAMALGDMETAVRWAQACGLDAEDKACYTQEFEYLTLARVRIAEGRPDEALQLLGRLGEAAQEGSRIRSHIEILALQALALASKGRTGHAVRRLEQALALAEAEGYVRLFVDEGAPMAALLTRVTGPYAEELLGAFPADDRQLTGDHRGSPGGVNGLIEPLSERELEVLRLIADGRSNQEIAEELVIAVTTAKKHVSNILGKLEVRSRTQAVARARRLGLL